MNNTANDQSRRLHWLGPGEAAPANGRFMPIENPSTGETLREAADGSYMDVVKAVQAANAGLVEWRRTTPAARALKLLAMADKIDVHADELAREDALEAGLPIRDGRARSIPAAASAFREAARAIEAPEARDRVDGGVTGLILPAFEPARHLARRLAAVWAAGGAAIAKPSRQTPSSALILARLALEAGLPAGLLNVVCGRGDEVGDALVSHPGVKWIAFAGSSTVGRKVVSTAIAEGKRAQASMGSRNVAIAFADLDLSPDDAQTAAHTLFSIHRPELRASRLFVQDDGSALERLAEAGRALIIGDALNPLTDIGPLPRKRWLDLHLAQVKGAESENGRPIRRAGSAEQQGWFAAPEFSADLTLCSPLQQDELPGPLVTHATFKYGHQAASRANASPFGQTFYVWSADPERARKLTSKLECGQAVLGLRAPPSGALTAAKNSAIGDEGLRAWLSFFGWSKTVVEP